MASTRPGPDEPPAAIADQAERGSRDTGTLEYHLEQVKEAFAVTRAPTHVLVYTNDAFRRLSTLTGEPPLGRPIVEVFAGRDTRELIAVLDRAARTGVVERDSCIASLDQDAAVWFCTAWPCADGVGGAGTLLIELRAATEADSTLALQRDVAERMLLSALRERGIADAAEASSRRATYLAAEGRRLAASLDEHSTLDAMSSMALPGLGAWCIVDLLDEDGTMRRLTLVHPDSARQQLLRQAVGWQPEPGDPFGLPAARPGMRPVLIASEIDAAVAAAAHDPETMRILRAVGIGPLLTVPLVVRERLVGAITFVGGSGDLAYSREDVELAEDLANRSALALDNARLHGEALFFRARAEAASAAKGMFLGTMSHELRTPLNAIGGYVDLIEMGLRGPVTEEQRSDLDRIRSNQKHLTALITDVLNFVRIDNGRVSYVLTDVAVGELLAASVALVEPLVQKGQLLLDEIACDPTVLAHADAERVTQILVNLLSNAIKFTPPGGRVTLAGTSTPGVVQIRVADTGVGIPRDKLDVIFDPFVQVRDGLAGRDSGTGLGLAISRDLARGMGGDLTVESTPGVGSVFTLTLPAAPRRTDARSP